MTAASEQPAWFHALRPELLIRTPRRYPVEIRNYLDPGQMCGRYEVVRCIGRGGYGEVYEAIDGADGRVALKVLRIDDARDRRAAQRLLLEAKTLRSIDHVNVVSYRDWGFFGESYLWLAMELLHGKTLFELLTAEGMMAVDRVCRIGRQVCSALVQAHAVGAVHRDIKPGNIFVLPGDVVKLLDFGVVKHRDVAIGTTAAVGTPLYMAPDYLRGGPGADGDPRWDLYALAMVMYECMTGRHPFVRPQEGPPSLGTVVQRHMSEPVPPLVEVLSGCPFRVSDAVTKGLEKDPGQRYPTAAAFEQELSSCCQLFAKADDLMDHLERLQRRSSMPPPIIRPSDRPPPRTGPDSGRSRLAALASATTVAASDAASMARIAETMPIDPSAGDVQSDPPGIGVHREGRAPSDPPGVRRGAGGTLVQESPAEAEAARAAAEHRASVARTADGTVVQRQPDEVVERAADLVAPRPDDRAIHHEPATTALPVVVPPAPRVPRDLSPQGDVRRSHGVRMVHPGSGTFLGSHSGLRSKHVLALGVLSGVVVAVLLMACILWLW